MKMIITNTMRMMKCTGKLLMIAAVAALTFASCSNEAVIDASDAAGEDLAIGFGTYVGNSSLRAAVTDKTALQGAGAGFYVLAWQTGGLNWSAYTPTATPNFMAGASNVGVNVTWGGAAWEYTPLKYWPGKYDGTNYGKVTFFGYAPKTSDVVVATSSGSDPKITFTTQDAASNQVDLVADMLPDQTATTISGGKVKFEFDHLLSKIGFNARLSAQCSGATVKITGLTIKYKSSTITKGGSYLFTETNTAGTIWTVDPSSYMTADDAISTVSVTLDNSASPTASAIDNGNFLMLIPQTPAAGDMVAELKYTVEVGSETQSYTIQALLPSVAWLPGKQYTYTFVLTLNPVIVDVDTNVNAWTAGSSPGDIPVD
jgi:hypothetical protein